MGVVFMAEQQEPVRRKVALKIIKPGMDTRAGDRPLRGRAAGPGPDGPPQHRPGPGGRGHRAGRPYFVMELVHGVPITDYCDQEQSHHARAAGVVRPGLPRRPARPSEGDHPSRFETLQRAGHAPRRRAGSQDHRLRRGQGHQPAADRKDALHRLRPDDRHPALHEPGAGRVERPGRGHAERHLLAGRAACTSC